MIAVERRPWRGRSTELPRLARLAEPVILEGALEAWHARCPPWSPRRLGALWTRLAGTRLVISSYSRGAKDGLLSYARSDARGQTWRDERKPFGALLAETFLARTPRAGVRYVQSAVLHQELPELAELYPDPFFGRARAAWLRQRSPRLWVGGGGHRVGLHYDTEHNLHCVIAGAKRFLLYPPEALPFVYLGAPERSPAGAPTALVDPLRPDLTRFPRFAEAAPLARLAELRGGDVLFLPALWLHHVESFGANAAITYWWSDISVDARARAEAALTHALLELRALPGPWRARYATLFDTFVWHRHGDPLAHLAPADQGLFGAADGAREAKLRAQLRQAMNATGALLEPFDPERHWALPAELRFRWLGAARLEALLPGAAPTELDPGLFELLRELAEPVRPRELAARKYPRDRAARERFLALCGALSRRGLLVPRPRTEAAAAAPKRRPPR